MAVFNKMLHNSQGGDNYTLTGADMLAEKGMLPVQDQGLYTPLKPQTPDGTYKGRK